ncbi:hypothetical protein NFI96_031504 [Prochilodus magdalenae]|nr:hypothetical protein NFI96_031504 [Prochilodus magdalenae]
MYFYTAVTQRTTLPEYTVVGLLDGEQVVYSDSNTRKMIPKIEWTKKIDMNLEVFKQMCLCAGVRTLQRMFGCELYDDGTRRVYDVFGLDGEDALTLDQKTDTWTAASQEAVSTKHKWQKTCDARSRKARLENACIYWLKTYMEYGGFILERKVPPEVSLFQKNSSSPVVCHATGFYPKAVMISWQKNGEDLYEDVELRETLPNQDGTFQRRNILTVPPEELNRNKYTCVVQHGELEKVLQVSDRRVLSGEGAVGVMAGVVVAVLLLILISCVGVCIWKKKKSGKKKDLPRSGAPRKISSRGIKMILRMVSTNPRTARRNLMNDLQRAGTKVTKAPLSNTHAERDSHPAGPGVSPCLDQYMSRPI